MFLHNKANAMAMTRIQTFRQKTAELVKTANLKNFF